MKFKQNVLLSHIRRPRDTISQYLKLVPHGMFSFLNQNSV